MNLGPAAKLGTILKYLVWGFWTPENKIYLNLLCDLLFIGIFDLKICVTLDLYV